MSLGRTSRLIIIAFISQNIVIVLTSTQTNKLLFINEDFSHNHRIENATKEDAPITDQVGSNTEITSLLIDNQEENILNWNYGDERPILVPYIDDPGISASTETVLVEKYLIKNIATAGIEELPKKQDILGAHQISKRDEETNIHNTVRPFHFEDYYDSENDDFESLKTLNPAEIPPNLPLTIVFLPLKESDLKLINNEQDAAKELNDQSKKSRTNTDHEFHFDEVSKDLEDLLNDEVAVSNNSPNKETSKSETRNHNLSGEKNPKKRSVVAEIKSLLVTTRQGPVRGYLRTEDSFYSFFGIPYATAPKGEHKFKGPLPPPNWTETFEATNDKVACPQVNSMNLQELYHVTFTPDCLVVNVFVPENITKNRLPVLVYIHGENFMTSYGRYLNHKHLINREIIVVNFNYRVGPHGFLCLGTKDIPGNAGLKDQVAALKWIQNNIDSFGGNKNDITLEGYGSGAASVEYLMLSPASQGLFHKAITGGGSCLSASAMQLEPIENAKNTAVNLGFTAVNDMEALEDFYKKVQVAEIYNNQHTNLKNGSLAFVPCIEKIKDGSFLIKPPLDIIKDSNYKKVPYMTGFSDKGFNSFLNFKDWMREINSSFADFLPADLSFKDVVAKSKVANSLKRIYFGEDIDESTVEYKFITYYMDIMVNYWIIKSAEVNAANGADVFVYQFSYFGEGCPRRGSSRGDGAFRCSPTKYIHELPDDPDTSAPAALEQVTRDRLVKLWSNFIKHGKPVLETSELVPIMWKPFTSADRNFLIIDKELKSGRRPLNEKMDFLDSVFEKYHRKPETFVNSGNSFRNHFKMFVLFAKSFLVLYFL